MRGQGEIVAASPSNFTHTEVVGQAGPQSRARLKKQLPCRLMHRVGGGDMENLRQVTQAQFLRDADGHRETEEGQG